MLLVIAARAKIQAYLGYSPIRKQCLIDLCFRCRYGAAEIHTVAAFIGGCAAQEVIKLVTGQYVPLNNTFVFNAMTTVSETFVL